jgi:MFS family permease
MPDVNPPPPQIDPPQEPGGSGDARKGGAGAAMVRAAGLVGGLVAWFARLIRGRVVQFVGGPARARVVLLFGAVLALSSAQIATVGAVAPQLEQSLHIGNTKIGLLNSVALIVGAIAVVPVGLLVDRFRRIPILAISMILWSITTMLGAFAGSYSTLLLSRIGLGAVTATAGPAIASLTGDYFPSRERGRVYGYILSGEIAGTAAGFVVSGTLASAFSWQVAFFVLGIPGLFIARSLWRTVPEPKRGGQSRLEPGTQDLGGVRASPDPGMDTAAAEGAAAAAAAANADGAAANAAAANADGAAANAAAANADGAAANAAAANADGAAADARDPAYDAASRRGFQPDPARVLKRDPDTLTLREAVTYVLRVPTNMLLIISSSLGYFFFAGLQTFAVVFIRGHYHASQGTATLVLGLLVLGSLVGTLVSGTVSDAIARSGRFEARVWVPAGCYLAATACLIPGLLAGSLGSAVWFDVAGAGFISAANPPLDAARLDIMPPGLWGRAESTRTFLRSLAQALAPLLFGGVADLIAGFAPEQAPIGTHTHQVITSQAGTGLQFSFLIMLVSLAAAGLFLLRARHTYPTDVATAGASWQPEVVPATPAQAAADSPAAG